MKSTDSVIFVSAPMSAFHDNTEFITFKRVILALVEALELRYLTSIVYYAGRSQSTDHSFSAPKQAFESDMAALRLARTFILLYPRPIATSALIELGFALSLNSTIVIVVKNREDLPYMIRDIDQTLSHVKILVVDARSFVDPTLSNALTSNILSAIPQE